MLPAAHKLLLLAPALAAAAAVDADPLQLSWGPRRVAAGASLRSVSDASVSASARATEADAARVGAVDVPPLEHWEALAEEQGRKLCYVEPSGSDGDDALTIADALNNECSSKALVVLPGETYNMRTNMTTVDLDDVHFNVFGRLLWSTDIDYWLSVSMEVGFQNQSTVWYFGGDGVVWDGHGSGTLDGNGQVWYDWAEGEGNLPHRPMMINWKGLNNSVVRRQRFVQSQMWTMATTWSYNVLFEDIYVNNTSSSEHSTLNTDGIDTIFSDNITMTRWDVTCGDDNIALKRNSTNIFVYDSVFHHGQGLAVGSVAQYKDEVDIVDTFYVRNITMYDTTYAIYLKTWPGNQNGYPPNGGGGGLGYAKNIVVEDIVLDRGRSAPFYIWQCEHYEGDMGKDCDSSQFQFSDLIFRGVSGTMNDGVVSGSKFRCSEASGGCNNVTIEDFSVTNVSSDEVLNVWWCHNVNEPNGFECSDFPPEEMSAMSDERYLAPGPGS